MQARWKHLYATHLPTLAKARDPAQSNWPVYLDHCFARIILDNAIGSDRPWTEVIKSPAVKNMTTDQFRNAIELGEKIASGETDINILNERSLELRGKQGPKRKAVKDDVESKPAKRLKSGGHETISSYFLPSPASPPPKDEPKNEDDEDEYLPTTASPRKDDVDMDAQIARINASNLTTFRKQTLTVLCQVPRGRYSTYQAMSDHITATSHKTCARAIGNAMRNNPFAPEVPCHRILAADGSLGGFNGHWGEAGQFAGEKRRLLAEEGVKFDSKGKVKGPVFRGFE